jgi:hypothetical protein
MTDVFIGAPPYPYTGDSSEIHHFVMADTERLHGFPYFNEHKGHKAGLLVMKTEKTEKDIPALLELLKMEAEKWPHPGTGEVSQSDLFRRDQTLLEMWPEACRRTGVGASAQKNAAISMAALITGKPGNGRLSKCSTWSQPSLAFLLCHDRSPLR